MGLDDAGVCGAAIGEGHRGGALGWARVIAPIGKVDRGVANGQER